MIYHQSKIFSFLVLAILVVLTTTFQFMAGPRVINYLVIAVICLSPLLLLSKSCRITLPHIDGPLILFLLFMWGGSIFLYPQTIRWSTLLYSTGFTFFFAMLARCIKQAQITSTTFSLFIRTMIYCYFSVMILQQCAILFDFPIVPNRIFQYHNIWKLNSLASEPAHTAFTIGLYMIFYALVERNINPGQSLLDNIRKKPFLWIAICWTMFSTHSASACIMFPIGLIPWLSKKNFLITFCAVILMTGLVFFTLSFDDTTQYQRVIYSSKAVFTLNEEEIINADLSASERIIPAVRCLKNLNITEKEFWVGHGVDADVNTLGNSPLNYKTEAYLFHIWYNFGILAFIPLLWLVLRICYIPKIPITIIITAAQFLMAAYVNSTPLWTIMAMMLIYRVATHNQSDLLSTTLRTGSKPRSPIRGLISLSDFSL